VDAGSASPRCQPQRPSAAPVTAFSTFVLVFRPLIPSRQTPHAAPATAIDPIPQRYNTRALIPSPCKVGPIRPQVSHESWRIRQPYGGA